MGSADRRLGSDMQTTLKRAITLVGMGLHSGRPARLVLRPATEGGILFRRVDVTDRDNLIPALCDRVTDTTLCTLARQRGGRLGRHRRAPDGGARGHRRDPRRWSRSTAPRCRSWTAAPQRLVGAILRTGLARGRRAADRDPHPEAGPLGAGRAYRPSSIAGGDAVDRLRDRLPRRRHRPPGACAVDGQRHLRARALRLPDLLPAADVEMMQANGLALGGSLDNAVVVDGGRVLNPGGLRRAGRVRAPQDARRARRPRARRRADPRRLPRASAPGTARPTGCCGRSSPIRRPSRSVDARCRGGGAAARCGRRRRGPAPRRLRPADEAVSAAPGACRRGLRFSFQPLRNLC